MGRKNGEPDYTCPMIDDEIKRHNAMMEDIRSANDKLRDWGREGWERAKDLEDEVADLKEEIATLRDELSSAVDERNQFKNESDELQEKIDALEQSSNA